MRVTQSMLNNQMLQNLRINNERLQKQQDMLSSGKRLNKAADDPVGVSFAMRYEAQLKRNEQYQRNLDMARSAVDNTDSVLSKVNDVMQRTRELAVQGANDTTPADAKAAIAKEVQQLYDELVNLGNTQFNGKYIFNGQMTDIKPYTTAGAETVLADPRSVVYAVADGVNVETNLTGQAVFGKPATGAGAEPDNLFAVMKQLGTLLQNNDGKGVSNLLGQIDSRMNKIQNAWAEVGARQNRLDLIQNRLGDAEVNLTRLKSQTEDADLAQVITNLKMAENVQRASLAAGARIIQPSLVDFLR